MKALLFALMLRICLPQACGPNACQDYAYPLTSTVSESKDWVTVRHRGMGMLARFSKASVQSIRFLRQG